MKKCITGVIVALAMMFGAKAESQSQCLTYSDNYAMYTTVNTDGINVYATTEVSGSGHMTIQSGNGCGSINYGQIQHTPTAVAVLTWNNGQSSTGGPVYGSSECPDCYIDITSTATVTPPDGSSIEYTYSAEGQIACNFVGNIFDVQEGESVTIGFAAGAYATAGKVLNTSSPNFGKCAYTLSCTPGTTLSCTSGGNVVYAPPDGNVCDDPGVRADWLWISPDRGTSRYCALHAPPWYAVKVPDNCW